MKLTTFVASTVLLFVTVCTASAATKDQFTASTSKPSFTEAKAIAKVVAGTSFPVRPESIHGSIVEGGPAPGRKIPAILQTKVKKDGGNSYLVTCTEWWNAKDFNGGNTDKSALEYHWTYKVSPNATILVSQGGDFPPQEAR